MKDDKALAPIKVSVTVLSQMFLYLTSLGINPDEFLRSLDIDPEMVKSPDTYLPIETYLHIQESAAEYTHDQNFGLHMGEYAEPGSWSILGYLMMNCKNLGEAFEKSGRYAHIIGNLIEGSVRIKFNKIKVILDTPPHAPKMSRHCFESTISSSVRMMRTLSGRDLSPLEVTFIYAQPESIAEYERVFKCPVLFEQKHNSFTIDMGLVNEPVLMGNPDLLAYFERYAQEFIAGLERKDATTQAVTKIILANLDDVSLSIRKVAKEMSVSVRTLQNHLSAEGVVFSDLLQAISASDWPNAT